MAFPAPALTLPGQLNSQVSSSAAPKFLPSYGLSNRSPGRNKCKRRKNIKVRVSMAPEADAGEAPPSSQLIFGGEKQLSGPEKVFESLSAPARYGVCAVIVAGALAAGYAVGATTKGTRTAAFGGALALGVAGGATAYALNSTAPRIAAAALHNKVVKCDDPTSLNREEIDSLLHKYGVSKQDEAFNAELCNLYERYVSSIIPSGNEDLKGDEAESIIKFKKALGIDDPDAAAVHIEIGRRIFRQRLETGDRDAVIAERRAFQKLVYVSNLVFGDASTFLLPWKLELKLELEFTMASKQNVVFAILLCIVYTCSSSVSAKSEAQQKPISVVLKGRVVCGHACSLDEENSSDTPDLISGVVVAVECRAGLNRKTNAGSVSIEGKTDKNGEFRVELPGSIIPSMLLCSSQDRSSPIKGYCSARLLSSPVEKFNVPSLGTSSSDQLIFTSEANGIPTFTFTSLSYHSGSKLCSHKISSDHESFRKGRALHEVNKGSSSNRAALFPHGNLPQPKALLGFPPFPLPLPLPLPLPPPFLNFPPFPLSVPPLPVGIPFPRSPPSP